MKHHNTIQLVCHYFIISVILVYLQLNDIIGKPAKHKYVECKKLFKAFVDLVREHNGRKKENPPQFYLKSRIRTIMPSKSKLASGHLTESLTGSFHLWIKDVLSQGIN